MTYSGTIEKSTRLLRLEKALLVLAEILAFLTIHFTTLIQKQKNELKTVSIYERKIKTPH